MKYQKYGLNLTILKHLQKRQKNYKENTHGLLKNLITLSQFAGFFPLHNVRHPNPGKLKFKWLSYKLVYTFIIFACAGHGASTKILEGSILNGLSLTSVGIMTSLLISIEMARKWKTFVLNLCKLEDLILRKYHNQTNLKKKIHLAVFCLLFNGFVEHIFFDLVEFYNIGLYGSEPKYMNYCNSRGNKCGVAGNIIFYIYYWVKWLAWNIGDCFISAISIILAERFSQISKSLESEIRRINSMITRGNNLKSESIFRIAKQIREDYNLLFKVMDDLNKIFSKLIIYSYFSNIAFVLIQLLDIVKRPQNNINKLYVVYSCGHMVIKITLITIFAASVHEESTRFIKILYRMPKDVWNISFQRLLIQIQYDPAAITGGNLFTINKGLILNIAASIITYELILIQFYENNW